MGSTYEFVHAAFPWVAMGLLVAIACALLAKQKKGGGVSENHIAVGMCLGLLVGVSLGPLIDQPALGMSLGPLLGAVLGMCFNKPVDGGCENDGGAEQ